MMVVLVWNLMNFFCRLIGLRSKEWIAGSNDFSYLLVINRCVIGIEYSVYRYTRGGLPCGPDVASKSTADSVRGFIIFRDHECVGGKKGVGHIVYAAGIGGVDGKKGDEFVGVGWVGLVEINVRFIYLQCIGEGKGEQGCVGA